MVKKRIEIDELKQIELYIMDEIDVILKENNLKYYLFGGTLIGAVRHHGFIPWDDDMDICMVRADYTKFEEIMRTTDNKKIRLLTPRITDGYTHCFGKVCAIGTEVFEPGIKSINGLGVFVDVFPLDNASQKLFLQKIQKVHLYINYKFRWLSSLRQYVHAKNKFFNIINYLGYLYANVKGPYYYSKKIDDIAQKQKFEGIYINSTGWRELLPVHIFQKAESCQFEDRVFPIPVGYDQLLTTLYGDYMTLPPEEKRHGSHGVSAYWIEEE